MKSPEKNIKYYPTPYTGQNTTEIKLEIGIIPNKNPIFTSKIAHHTKLNLNPHKFN